MEKIQRSVESLYDNFENKTNRYYYVTTTTATPLILILLLLLLPPPPPPSPSTTTTTTTTTTQYTIQEEGVDPKTLEKTVNKHCENIHVFVKEKPIAAHTKEAFLTLKQELVLNRPVILDSGCGTGKSTLLLGQKYPNHTIIGIDRSIARLAKNVVYNHQKEQQQSSLPPPNNSSSSLPSSSSS